MTTDDTGRRRPLEGKVDFTLMYVAHDAFDRDLRRLAAAVQSGRTAEPGVRAGWETFKEQLHIHHTAEDVSVWPALREKVTRPDHVAVLDAMQAEHARIDPLLSRVDSSLAAGDRAGLAENAEALAAALADHMEHEENQALPLVETFLGPAGWAKFAHEMRKSQGLRGGAEFFPWMLDDAPAATRKRVLGLLPPPARLLYRAVWAPGYARTRRWDAAAT
jgi:hemerythrin-like domain-containing protein